MSDLSQPDQDDLGEAEAKPAEPIANGLPADDGIWPYLGVGCLTAVIGLVGGGMLGVMVSKIVGAAQACATDPETRAPCNWTMYWTWGARIGLVLVPSIAIYRMRRGRMRHRNKQ